MAVNSYSAPAAGNAQSPIGANNCPGLRHAFTMEGTTVEATGPATASASASLVLGIVGIPASCTIILPILAIIFGGIGYAQVSSNDAARRGKGLAIAGNHLRAGGVHAGPAVPYELKRADMRSFIQHIPRTEARAACISLGVGIAILIIKFTAYFITQSAAIFSDAVESIANVLASSVALYALSVAHRPADLEHPWGHGQDRVPVRVV